MKFSFGILVIFLSDDLRNQISGLWGFEAQDKLANRFLQFGLNLCPTAYVKTSISLPSLSMTFKEIFAVLLSFISGRSRW